MKAQHTPGPWQQSARQPYSVIGTCARDICMILDSGSDIQKANARLIAAAPELLDALKALMSRDLDHRLHGFPELEKARAAIVKAEGAQ